MIQWSLTLTGNQIRILKALEPRVFGKPHDYDDHDISHWVGGIRPLIREGLLEHREVKRPDGYIDPLRTGQFLTDRGRFILQMIEQDLAKFIKPLERKKQTKKLKAVAA